MESGNCCVVSIRILPKLQPISQTSSELRTSSRNPDMAPNNEKYAVVTGGNKGIGLETVRKLATEGVTVVLTARNEKRGMEATKQLQESGLSNVVFHQLDVSDSRSIQSLAKYIATQFKRLDILVNNAGIIGVVVDEDGLKTLNVETATQLASKSVLEIIEAAKTTYETVKECLDTNYYGVKSVTKALLPLLQLSSGARIVNVSSTAGELRNIRNDEIRNELGSIDLLTEKKIDRIVERFIHDFQSDALDAHGWQKVVPAYSISKAAVNAYTRVIANKHPEMRVNCVHPGVVTTDMIWHAGTITPEKGAEASVKAALLPEDGPTGCYFDRSQLAEF